MRRFYIWLWLLLLVCGSCTKEKQELSVLHLNIWMEGTVVKNGFEAVADEVARINGLDGFRNINPGTVLLFPHLMKNG